jgi:nucleoside-diphosphate-sugar epimerase
MRHVLLTGFPGLLASEIVAGLADRDATITLLVEERFLRHARELVGNRADRLHVVAGDITRAALGLAPQITERLRASCDTVLHLAAVYDLAVGRQVAERVNVRGTEHVNAFARALPLLRRYGYVSTIVVAGRRRGTILEDELEHDAGFHNLYEETKYRAEVAVRALQREGLPVTILRPGVVVGRSTNGWTTKYDGPYMILRLLDRLPGPLRRVGVGSKTVPFPVVPVDFVARGAVAILESPDTFGKTFHLTDPNPLSSAELFGSLCEAYTGKPPRFRLPGGLVRLSAALGLFRLFGLPGQAIPYLFHACHFDCSNTLAGLEGTGIACPPAASYLDALVRFYRDHPEGGRPTLSKSARS